MDLENDISNAGIFDFLTLPLIDNLDMQSSGENLKNTLICSADENKGEVIDFVGKVLKSVEIDLDKDTLSIFISPGQQFSFINLGRSKDIRTALFFGLKPSDAGLHFELQKYTPFEFGPYTFLFCDRLADIRTNATLKRPLWEALKTLFK